MPGPIDSCNDSGSIQELHFQNIFDNAPIGVFRATPEGRIILANAALLRMFGYESQKKMIASITDIANQVYADPAERNKFMRQLKEHGEVLNHECRFRRRDGTVFWGAINVSAIRDNDGQIAAYQGFSADISEQKKADEKLKQLEWMLSGKPISNSEFQAEVHDQGYGDLTELNRDGLILKSIGRDRLEKLANDYLELLGTSSAIYEANGDYALGIFTSGWCRMMDRTSRNLCDTEDNAEALDSGRWLCHESCWTDCSKRAIAECAPVDIACSGGIRMYAVPILAHGNVVGTINVGYGDPPNDPKTLRKLSKDYHLDFDKLALKAEAYNSRPPFIIELAKNRLHSTARLIGSIIEAKQADEALRKSEEHSTFLAETAFEMVELTSIQGIYSYTVRKLYDLFEAKSIVALVEYNHSENRWKMQQIEGIGKKAAELSRLLGFDINTLEGEISTKYYKQITSGRVEELKFDFPGLFNNKLSVAVGRAVKKMFSVEKMYCIAFQQDEQIIGNITIITNKKIESINTKLIEAFIQQVATFVKKQKAEEKIREKDIQFRKLSANLPDLIFQFTRRPDGSYYVPIASEGVKNIFGCQPEDVADNFDAITRVLHPDDAERVINDIEYSAKHLTYFTCEFRVLIPGRPVQWIFSRSTPEKLPDGSVTWYGFNANITQRKQAEEALRESEATIRNKLKAITEPDGDIEELNLGDIIDSEELQAMMDDFYRASKIGGAILDISGKVLVDVGWQDICKKFHRMHPVSVKNCLESDLALASGVPEGTFKAYRCKNNMWDMVSPIMVGEKHLGNIYIGQFFYEDEHVDYELFRKQAREYGFDEEEYLAALDRVPRMNRETVESAMTFFTKLAKMISSLSYSKVKLSRDIAARKRAEEEKEKLQSQLLQAQKMKSVGQLAGGVAHDFNNMLGVILGHTEMALEQIAPEQPLFENLQEIRKAAERSVNLTRQLLTFARKQIIAPRIIDLNETVEGTLKMLRRLIGENIELVWLSAKNLVPVQVDPSQIDQILANLCINARDAINLPVPSEEPTGQAGGVGKITIETGVVSFDEDYCAANVGFIPGEYVMLAVSDNGCGMKKETVNHLFEPFFTTKEQGSGTGLGLASVYGAVKQNNGFINVYSEPGQGTTFKIYLPRQQSSTTFQADKAVVKPTANENETILLVEDELGILHMAAMMLKNLGYEVIAAETPVEAIRLANENCGPIKLLMTDVVMPKMNGRELADRLKIHNPTLKVLFMSGYTANVIAHQGVLDEGVSFIQKPFSSHDLAVKVYEVLEGKNSG